MNRLTDEEIKDADEHFGISEDSDNGYLDELMEDMEDGGEDMAYLSDGAYMLSDGTIIYTNDD